MRPARFETEMSERIWGWQGGKVHRARNEIEIRNLRYDAVYRTLCGLSLIGPNRYNEKKRIPDFMKKWHCKRCQKKEAQMKK